MQPYHKFRTGLTFADVVMIMWAEREQSYAATGQYKGSPSRSLVLGKWRAIKLSMYSGYTAQKQEEKARALAEGLPF